MNLSNLNLGQLDTTIACLDKALAHFPSAQIAFRRITKTKTPTQPLNIDLYANHAQAEQTCRSFGIPLLDARPEDGFSWDGGSIATQTETAVLLHELAHWQIAPGARRCLPDFGLGAGPETGSNEISNAACRVNQQTKEKEENLASLLGVLWEVELGGPAIVAFCEQNWLELVDRPGAASHFLSVFEDLQMRKLIDQSGHPTMGQQNSLWRQSP